MKSLPVTGSERRVDEGEAYITVATMQAVHLGSTITEYDQEVPYTVSKVNSAGIIVGYRTVAI